MGVFSGSKCWVAVLAAGIIGATSGASSAWAIEVEVSNAPESDLALTVEAIRSAHTSLQINIYELTSSDVANAILDQVRAGIRVELIEEGQPVGGLSTAAKGIQSQIAQAMRQGNRGSHLYEMTSNGGNKRRYRYDHAKYVVIDGSALLIGSENYSPSGNPVPGTLGNRGWEVLIHDATIAKKFEGVFRRDSDTSFGDVIDLTGARPGASPQLRSPMPSLSRPIAPSPSIRLSASSVTDVFSPDTSESSLLNLLRSARSRIDIEQMTLDSTWNGAARSPLIDELVAAAERGVHVRVLLNDDRVFAHPGHPFNDKNKASVDLLNQIASQKKLPLSAHIANLKGMGVDYIHNKGALVDGQQTLISSINWNQNSITHNRESAVIIDSPSVNSYFQALYDSDWTVSQVAGATPSSSGLFDPRDNGAGLVSPPVAGTEMVCPSQVRLDISVSSLKLADSEDQDFKFLSGRKWTEALVRDVDAKGCVLVAQEKTKSVQDSIFFEIRRNSAGQTYFSLEGYTPKSAKVYSIRGTTSLNTDVAGLHPATVYDGSGPTREKLGDALVSITTQSK